MSKLFRKRIFFPIIGAVALVFSLVWALMSAPNVYADTSYTYSVSDINFKTASADGFFTISKSTRNTNQI